MVTYPKIIPTTLSGYPKMTRVTAGNSVKRELADEGAWPKIQVVEEEGHPRVTLLSTFLDEATTTFGGIEPLHYWDFTTDRTIFSSLPRGNFINTPNISITRAGYSTSYTLANEIVLFGPNTPRITDRGLRIDSSKTNQFLNSAVGVTQDVTVTLSNYVLSFFGTGTITLTGASTAGPLVGTGATDRVKLAFTPAAGTLTLTVSGSCTAVQLEVSSAGGASTWIPTENVSVTRGSDIVYITGMGLAAPLTIYAEFEKGDDTNVIRAITALEDTVSERMLLRINVGEETMAQMTTGGVSQGDSISVATTTAGTVYKLAGSFAANRVQGCLDGVLSSVDTVATVPTSLENLFFGTTAVSGGNNIRGYIRRMAIFNTALNDAQLQAITT